MQVYFGTQHAKIYLNTDLFGINCVTGMSCLFRKDVLEDAGGFAYLGKFLAEDYYLGKLFIERYLLLFIFLSFPHRMYVFLCLCNICCTGLCFAVSVAASVCSIFCIFFHPVSNIFILLHKWILMKFTGVSQYCNRDEMITFWVKLEKIQGSRIRHNIQININHCCRDVKQVLMPSKWIHKFHCTD